ncbi:MAG: hypothetical protein ACLP5E_02140 [Streptosporangiaceae bacterium]
MTHEYRHHPWVRDRRQHGPVQVGDQLDRSNWYKRVNARIAVWVTIGVGSMTCAWVFAALAIAGLPTAMKPGNIGLLFWISSDFLQLTLLSIIIVGQNILAKASDKRAIATYNDGEANLHEILAAQDHLLAQDRLIEDTQAKILAAIAGILGPAGERTP